MRTSTALATLLAAGAIAQPHIHARNAHQKHHRDLEKRMRTSTEWVTEWVTRTVTLDAGEDIPKPTTSAEPSAEASPGNFKDHTRTHTKEESSESSIEVAEPTTSSSAVVEEPEPTTVVEPEVQTPTTAAPPPAETTTQAEEPEPTTTAGNSGGGSSGGSDTYSGDITFYSTGLGACGFTDSNPGSGASIDDPMVVAISAAIWFANPPGGNPNKVEWCNKKIAIHAPGSSKTAYGIIRDSCEGCQGQGDVDVNLAGMQQLYPNAESDGRKPVTWSFIS